MIVNVSKPYRNFVSISLAKFLLKYLKLNFRTLTKKFVNYFPKTEIWSDKKNEIYCIKSFYSKLTGVQYS